MKTVILCGGAGMRLREETEVKPKPMVPIGRRPILWHIMRAYAHHGFDEFVLCLGYKGAVIKQFFYDYEWLAHDFTVRPGQPPVIHRDHEEALDWTVTCADTGRHADTGERIRRVRRHLDGDRFFVTYGDGVSDVDLAEVLRFHQARGKLATLVAVRPSSRFGELTVDEDGVATSFREKPQVDNGWINGGFMVFEAAALDWFKQGVGSLEDGVLVPLAEARQLAVFRHDGFWQCMDTHREMMLLQQLWDDGQAPWAVWRSGG